MDGRPSPSAGRANRIQVFLGWRQASLLLKATQRKEELGSSLERIVQDSESMERVKAALVKVHMENLRNASFEEKMRILNVLDVKVYPSENLDAIAVTCAVNLALGWSLKARHFRVITPASRHQSCRSGSRGELLPRMLG